MIQNWPDNLYMYRCMETLSKTEVALGICCVLSFLWVVSKYVRKGIHAREPLYTNSAVTMCWLQSTVAQNSVPSC